MKITCIVCGKKLDTVFEEEQFKNNVQPAQGTMWTSTGNYGSTVYDPMHGGERLFTVICDDCLVKHSDRVIHFVGEDAQPWKPKRSNTD